MNTRLFALCLFALSGPAAGDDPLTPAIDVQIQVLREAGESQARIDQTHAETRALLESYRNQSRELEGLRGYNRHLEKMLLGQQASIASLESQLEDVGVTHREIIPLMTRMVQSLGQFVELDLPFQLDERSNRVAELQALIDAPDASLAEKYRRILDAYRTEVEYGRTVDAYREKLEIGGRERTLDFLRVGRVVLLYRSLDGKEAGVWDGDARRWKSLPDSYRTALAKGFRVARKQAAPDLLILPIPVPEVLP